MNYHLGGELDLVLRSQGLAPLVQERVSYISNHGVPVTDVLLVYFKEKRPTRL
jgi:hypothetical protein